MEVPELKVRFVATKITVFVEADKVTVLEPKVTVLGLLELENKAPAVTL